MMRGSAVSTDVPQPVTVTLGPCGPIDALAHDWRDLESRAHPSFFTSWTWIGSWLGTLQLDTCMLLLRARMGERIVGLAVLGRRTLRRYAVMPSKGYFLHATGDRVLDAIMMEYNGFLIQGQFAETVEARMLEHLLQHVPGWEELHLGGLTRVPSALRSIRPHRLREDRRPAFSVDLEMVRASSGGYSALLGNSTKSQLRRSERAYRRLGPVTVRVAASLDEARAFLQAMKTLHQAHWQARGAAGAFASEFANRFHDRLLETGSPRKEIQLLGVCAGGHTFAFLYNFMLGGRIYNYQAGIDYARVGAISSPGLIAHARGIEVNANAGHRIYDFMAGDQRYKRSLSTHSTNLHWTIVQRNLLKFRIEERLRQVKRLVGPQRAIR